VERAVAHGTPKFVQRHVGRGLAVDLAVRPFRETDAHATEAAPPRVIASIACASLVLADLVQTHLYHPLSRSKACSPPSRATSTSFCVQRHAPLTNQSGWFG